MYIYYFTTTSILILHKVHYLPVHTCREVHTQTFKKEIKEIPWPMFQELAITSYGSEDLDLQRNLGAFALVTGRFKDARINLMAAGAEFMLGIFDDIYFAYGLHAATREDADTDKICRLLQAKCESAEDCGTWKKLINKLCQ